MTYAPRSGPITIAFDPASLVRTPGDGSRSRRDDHIDLDLAADGDVVVDGAAEIEIEDDGLDSVTADALVGDLHRLGLTLARCAGAPEREVAALLLLATDHVDAIIRSVQRSVYGAGAPATLDDLGLTLSDIARRLASAANVPSGLDAMHLLHAAHSSAAAAQSLALCRPEEAGAA